MLFFWDYILLFEREVSFFWMRRFALATALYLVGHYAALLRNLYVFVAFLPIRHLVVSKRAHQWAIVTQKRLLM